MFASEKKSIWIQWVKAFSFIGVSNINRDSHYCYITSFMAEILLLSSFLTYIFALNNNETMVHKTFFGFNVILPGIQSILKKISEVALKSVWKNTVEF